MTGKTILITGGTGGIGYATAIGLARLEVLVNNVGGFWATRKVTADGLEHTFAVTTWPASCSPICCSTGSRPAPPSGS